MGIDITDNLRTISLALQPSQSYRTCLIDASLQWLENKYGSSEADEKQGPIQEYDSPMDLLRQQLNEWKQKGPMSVSVLIKNSAGHFTPAPDVPTFNGLDDLLCDYGMSGLVHFLLNWRYDAGISYGQCIDILDWIDRIVPLMSDEYFQSHTVEIRKVFEIAVTNKGFVTCG